MTSIELAQIIGSVNAAITMGNSEKALKLMATLEAEIELLTAEKAALQEKLDEAELEINHMVEVSDW